jgi:hypothetical protein
LRCLKGRWFSCGCCHRSAPGNPNPLRTRQSSSLSRQNVSGNSGYIRSIRALPTTVPSTSSCDWLFAPGAGFAAGLATGVYSAGFFRRRMGSHWLQGRNGTGVRNGVEISGEAEARREGPRETTLLAGSAQAVKTLTGKPLRAKSSGDPPQAALNMRIAEVAAALRIAGRWDTLLPRRWRSLRRRQR